MSIVLVQTIQLACFASIFLLMAQALRDEHRGERRSLLWLAATCVAGAVGAALPETGVAAAAMAAPVAYALLYITIVEFAGRGRGGRWVVGAVVLGAAAAGGGLRIACAALAAEAMMMARVLLAEGEAETRVPRAAMAAVLGLSAAVSAVRAVASIRVQTIEEAAAVLHLLSSSVLPIGFLWMLHARQQARMARENTLDPLTQLLNRRGLEVAGERELARYGRTGRDFAIVVLDIDHFKRLNDVYAHAGGDRILEGVAGLLRERLRAHDTVGRQGGEEFVLLLPDTDEAGAQRLIERLRTTLAAHGFRLGAAEEVRITASFGITCSSGRQGLGWGGMLHEADLALYAAKHAGRNVTRVYSGELADPLMVG